VTFSYLDDMYNFYTYCPVLQNQFLLHVTVKVVILLKNIFFWLITIATLSETFGTKEYLMLKWTVVSCTW